MLAALCVALIGATTAGDAARPTCAVLVIDVSASVDLNEAAATARAARGELPPGATVAWVVFAGEARVAGLAGDPGEPTAEALLKWRWSLGAEGSDLAAGLRLAPVGFRAGHRAVVIVVSDVIEKCGMDI